ncbi:unnamed protein product [Rhizophagus irregularis]|nr:unnamed protein product [Rhizophagus irregularis]
MPRHTRHRSHYNVHWNWAMMDELVDIRRDRNRAYHNINGRSRQDFWDSVANRINRIFRTRVSGQQCSQKWRNLVRDYHNYVLYRNGNPGRRLWTRTGARYYREFRTRFWERPVMRDDRRARRNLPTYRRRR